MSFDSKIIDGKLIAKELYDKLRDKINLLKEKNNLVPGLAVILVGEDPASQIYVKNKIIKAKELGVNIFEFIMPDSTSERTLKSKIEALNNDRKVHGILVQLPLPDHIDQNQIINTIKSEKDVDGFTIQNVGLLNSWQECLEPSTPQACNILIKRVLGENLSGKKAVILGRSLIVGRPLSAILIRENCTVTLLHSKSLNIIDECRDADVVISATGNPHSVKSDLLKRGAVVIDVGITRLESGKIVGDVDFNDVIDKVSYITPVPGGVGPMTVACMLSNTVKAACLQNDINFSFNVS